MLAAACAAGCNPFEEDAEPACLYVSISRHDYVHTAAAVPLPDSVKFLLTVLDGRERTVYDGAYGDFPSAFSLARGKYTVRLRSTVKPLPDFDSPVFGEDCTLKLSSGEQKILKLRCMQLNSGLRINAAASVISDYPDCRFSIHTPDGGMELSPGDARTVYFTPGEVELSFSSARWSGTLIRRELHQSEILTVGVNPQGSEDGHKPALEIDTLRLWTGEETMIPEDAPGSEGNPLNVHELRGYAGQKGIWAYGYIVGAFKSRSSPAFSDPYPSDTNLILAGKTSAAGTEGCISVELKKGKIREALNLVDHPDLTGRKLFVKCTVAEAYYGIPGCKAVTEYRLE